MFVTPRTRSLLWEPERFSHRYDYFLVVLGSSRTRVSSSDRVSLEFREVVDSSDRGDVESVDVLEVV